MNFELKNEKMLYTRKLELSTLILKVKLKLVFVVW